MSSIGTKTISSIGTKVMRFEILLLSATASTIKQAGMINDAISHGASTRAKLPR